VTLEVGALQFLNGLTFAALLFMLASGFTLIYGLMRIMNLAHGGFYLVGGYVGLSVLLATKNFLLAALAAGVAIAVLGVLTERVLLRRLRGDTLAEVLLTIGLAYALGDVALAIWGGDPRNIAVPGAIGRSIQFAGVTYPLFRLVVLSVGVVIGAAIWLLQERTRIGATIRAGVDDRETLEAMGINVKALFTWMFCFGAFLAGLTGVLGGAFLTLYPGADFEILLFGLVVVIIGGPGSLTGAAIGSLLVGLIDAFGKVFVPEFTYFTIFLPMALILTWRPYGLFGRPA
jgi:branched-chain amino acid transport system permease protein